MSISTTSIVLFEFPDVEGRSSISITSVLRAFGSVNVDKDEYAYSYPSLLIRLTIK